MARESFFARWSDYRLNRLELVFAVIVLLVLVSVFLNYMVVMLARAERAMVETSIVNVNAALRLYVAQRYVEQEIEQYTAMQQANPIGLLEQLPDWDISDRVESQQVAALMRARGAATLPNYAGEMDEAAAVELARGSWYFDTGDNTLVYLVRNSEVFHSDAPGRARLRWQLQLDYDDQDADGRFTAGTDRVKNVAMQPLDDYQWLF